jgi:RHS repeat-associated protein
MVGQKVYEMANHLGNVLVAVSDGRFVLNSGSNVTGYTAVVKSAMDYSVFGVALSGRTFSSPSFKYGFNGKEKDAEMYGSDGSSYDFGARMYDARVGRWLSCDPLEDNYPSLTTYNFSANSPIFLYDPDGRIIKIHYVDANGQSQYYNYTPGIKPTVDNAFVQKVHESVSYTMGCDPNSTFQTVADDPNKVHIITEGTDPVNSNFSHVTGGTVDNNGNIQTLEVTTEWNPNLGSYSSSGTDGKPNAQAPSTILLHETGHVFDYFRAKTEKELSEKGGSLSGVNLLKGYSNSSDLFVINSIESPAINEINERERRTDPGIIVGASAQQQGLRSGHNGTFYETTGVNSISPLTQGSSSGTAIDVNGKEAIINGQRQYNTNLPQDNTRK